MLGTPVLKIVTTKTALSQQSFLYVELIPKDVHASQILSSTMFTIVIQRVTGDFQDMQLLWCQPNINNWY